MSHVTASYTPYVYVTLVLNSNGIRCTNICLIAEMLKCYLGSALISIYLTFLVTSVRTGQQVTVLSTSAPTSQESIKDNDSRQNQAEKELIKQDRLTNVGHGINIVTKDSKLGKYSIFKLDKSMIIKYKKTS